MNSGIALFVILSGGILICWLPEYAAVAGPQSALFLLAIAWLAHFARGRVSIRYDPLLIPLAALFLWGIWQGLTNHTIYAFETWKSVIFWAANLTALFLALQFFSTAQARARFLHGLVWFGFGLSLISITQYFTSPGRVYWLFPTKYTNLLGPFIYKNQYAAFIELVLPVAMYRAFFQDRRSFFDAAAAAAMFATVMASLSRAGSVLVIGEIVIIGAMAWLRGTRAQTRAAVAIMAGLCLVFTAVAGWQLTWNRIGDREPFELRRDFVRSSWAMLHDRPWTGFGLGTWRTAYPAYALIDNGQIANRAHCDWMEWAVEGGIPFLLMMVAVFALSAPRAIRSVWGVGILAIFLHCLVDYPTREPALAMLFFAILGTLPNGGRPAKAFARETATRLSR